eukprot:5091804-Pleurochrysis_carterae.AAC.3
MAEKLNGTENTYRGEGCCWLAWLMAEFRVYSQSRECHEATAQAHTRASRAFDSHEQEQALRLRGVRWRKGMERPRIRGSGEAGWQRGRGA